MTSASVKWFVAAICFMVHPGLNFVTVWGSSLGPVPEAGPTAAPHPPAGPLLGLVRVESESKACSGTLVGRDVVLTAAHCFCSENLIGDNHCESAATVVFQVDPAVPGSVPVSVTGQAIVHPRYRPSWIDLQYEHDLAMIRLYGEAPSHVPALAIADRDPALGTSVRIAGFGRTGADCSGPSGKLTAALVTVDAYEDGGEILRFDDRAFCPGDSGGAVMNPEGTLVYAVWSTYNWTLRHGWVDKSIVTHAHREWIRRMASADVPTAV